MVSIWYIYRSRSVSIDMVEIYIGTLSIVSLTGISSGLT